MVGGKPAAADIIVPNPELKREFFLQAFPEEPTNRAEV